MLLETDQSTIQRARNRVEGPTLNAGREGVSLILAQRGTACNTTSSSVELGSLVKYRIETPVLIGSSGRTRTKNSMAILRRSTTGGMIAACRLAQRFEPRNTALGTVQAE